MSAPKVDVLQQLQIFLHDHQQEVSLDSYAVFQGVSAIIQKNNPEDPSTIEDLKRIFPQGEWISLWKDGFQKRYETAESISKKKNVFADWVFQGMVYNMPKGEFIAKSFERLDNLTDVTGLQDEKGMTSYQKTIFTTKNTYLIRLKNLSIYPLISVMNLALDANNPYIKKITHDVKSRVNIPSTGGE